jgi:F-type H+-transporting ATPase subunit gamma
MEHMLASLAASVPEGAQAPKLLQGTGKDAVHLIVVATSDRGLCGAFNSSIIRATRRKIRELQGQGKTVKLFCVGRKGYEQLHLEFGKLIIAKQELKSRKLGYSEAEAVAEEITKRFEAGEFDVAHIVYNSFKSAIAQVVTWQQLIPLDSGFRIQDSGKKNASSPNPESRIPAPYEVEPSEEELLAQLLPRNLAVQAYHALLENAASEQGARMTAMDNATRNAGDMIKKLTIKYNRTRQAAITKELIEIISGAEAV